MPLQIAFGIYKLFQMFQHFSRICKPSLISSRNISRPPLGLSCGHRKVNTSTSTVVFLMWVAVKYCMKLTFAALYSAYEKRGKIKKNQKSKYPIWRYIRIVNYSNIFKSKNLFLKRAFEMQQSTDFELFLMS